MPLPPIRFCALSAFTYLELPNAIAHDHRFLSCDDDGDDDYDDDDYDYNSDDDDDYHDDDENDDEDDDDDDDNANDDDVDNYDDYAEYHDYHEENDDETLAAHNLQQEFSYSISHSIFSSPLAAAVQVYRPFL